MTRIYLNDMNKVDLNELNDSFTCSPDIDTIPDLADKITFERLYNNLSDAEKELVTPLVARTKFRNEPSYIKFCKQHDAKKSPSRPMPVHKKPCACKCDKKLEKKVTCRFPMAKPSEFVLAPSSAPAVKRVIFNDPATIVFWEDGTKTVVRCSLDDFAAYSPEAGFAIAYATKALGKGGIRKIMNRFLDAENADKTKNKK